MIVSETYMWTGARFNRQLRAGIPVELQRRIPAELNRGVLRVEVFLGV